MTRKTGASKQAIASQSGLTETLLGEVKSWVVVLDIYDEAKLWNEVYPDIPNPRRGNTARIKDSIKDGGYYPSIQLQAKKDDGTVSHATCKGNHTLKGLRQLHQEKPEKFGRRQKFILLDVDYEAALRIVLKDNVTSDYGTYDNSDLYLVLTELERTPRGLAGTGYATEDYDALARQLGKLATFDDVDDNSSEEDNSREERKEQLTAEDVPDALWPSNNDYGIPTLDGKKQCDAIDLPVLCWGSQRGRKMIKQVGTYLFYTADDIIDPVWTNPAKMLNSNVVNAVEVNFSIQPSTPLAIAAYNVYRKRWLARYWQSKGIRILVDLHVALEYEELNLLGVPKGWRAYAARGGNDVDIEKTLTHQYDLAIKRAATTDILFLVYGGVRVVKELCRAKDWVWIPEEMGVSRGMFTEEAENPRGKLKLKA